MGSSIRLADQAGLGRRAQGGKPDAGLRQQPQHRVEELRPLVPPVPEQLGVEGGHHQRLAAVPVAQLGQPGHHRGDEVPGVAQHRGRGQLLVPGPLRLGRHGAAGDPGRPEARGVVEGVEVAVAAHRRGSRCGRTRSGRTAPGRGRRPARRMSPDRTGQAGVATHRRAVHQEVRHPVPGVEVLHARCVAALRRPDAGPAPSRTAARASASPVASCAAANRSVSSGWNGWVAGPDSSSTTPASASGRSTADSPPVSHRRCRSSRQATASRRSCSASPAVARPGGQLLGAQLPAGRPSEWISARQYGSSSIAATTGVTPRVRTSR